MKPLVFTKDGKRIATLTPQEGKQDEVFTLGTAAANDIVVAADAGLAAKQLSFALLGGVWWVGDLAGDGRLMVDGRLTARAPVAATAEIAVGAFACTVSCEADATRKTRRETASDILYSHALAALSNDVGRGLATGAELEARVNASLDAILARSLPELSGFTDEQVADLRRETVEDMLGLGRSNRSSPMTRSPRS